MQPSQVRAKMVSIGPRVPPACRAADAACRVFLYSHDTYGLGHLRRNLAIAEHLLSDPHAFSVRLLTGSPVINSWTLPSGLDVTALPPVVKTDVETYAPRSSAQPFPLVKAHREALIFKTVVAEAPDIFLVDHAPGGMNAELLATLAFIRKEMRGTHVILGLRDILDSPDTVRKIWAEQSTIALLDALYDRVVVYGSPEIMDIVEAYELPERVAEKVSYCGYISRPALPAAVANDEPPLVVVTVGGGEDGYFLMEAYLRILHTLSPGSLRTMFVTGPLMSDCQRNALKAQAAAHSQVEIVATTQNLPAIFARADLIVAMSGYNTCVEIIASGKPAILVPREAPRAEQRLRAATLARLGMVWSVEPGPDLDGRLSDYMGRALAGERPVRTSYGLDLNGTIRVCDLLKSMAQPSARAMEVTA